MHAACSLGATGVNRNMVYGIVFYFLLMTALLAWLLLPPVRSAAIAHAQRWRLRSRAATLRAAAAVQTRARRTRAGAGMSMRGLMVWLGRWRVPLVGALALLVLVPGLALGVRSWWRFDGYDHTATRAVDEHIAALLRGEELVPPPPLPPELFGTPEIEMARPLTRTASRQWELLDPEFRRRLLLVFRLLKERHGYEAVLIEGYRSPQRQAELAGLGPQVTRAGAYESYHQYGLAADVAFLRDGRIVISEADPWAMRGYEHTGALARSLGLTWGGDWRSLRDWGHFELTRPEVLAAARAAASARNTPAAPAVQTLSTRTP